MRAAKRRINGAVLAALLLMVATAPMATAKAGPAARAAGSCSPLLAAVYVGLEVDQALDIGAHVVDVAGVELALEAPRSWTYLDDLARFAADAKWRLEVDSQDLLDSCLEPRAGPKSRVRGYQLSGGGSGAATIALSVDVSRLCVLPSWGNQLTGLFVTADPLGYVDGPSRYAFAGFDPVNAGDPLGLLTVGECGFKWGDEFERCLAEKEAKGDERVDVMLETLNDPAVQGPIKVAQGCFMEMPAGAAAVAGGGPLGVVGGGTLVLHGADVCGSGIRILQTGENQETATHEAISEGVENLGVDPETAEMIAINCELALASAAGAACMRSTPMPGGQGAEVASSTRTYSFTKINMRHRIDQIKQKSTAKKGINTVVESWVDVAEDISLINAGKAVRNGDTFAVDGRVYATKGNGTLYPVSGEGFHQMSTGAYKSLGVYNEFGNTERANWILDQMEVAAAEREAALAVWQSTQ